MCVVSSKELIMTTLGNENVFSFADGNGNEAAVHDFLSSLDVHNEVWIGLHQATPLDRFHWM